jgi:hypothetical protein
VIDDEGVFRYPVVVELKLVQMAFGELTVLNNKGLAGASRIAAFRSWTIERDRGA